VCPWRGGYFIDNRLRRWFHNTDGLAGITYTHGPLTYRCVYSYGVYDNPYGRQGMLVPGITAKITSNVTLWFEYTSGTRAAVRPRKVWYWKTVIR
jgi:hypothetical protein